MQPDKTEAPPEFIFQGALHHLYREFYAMHCRNVILKTGLLLLQCGKEIYQVGEVFALHAALEGWHAGMVSRRIEDLHGEPLCIVALFAGNAVKLDSPALAAYRVAVGAAYGVKLLLASRDFCLGWSSDLSSLLHWVLFHRHVVRRRESRRDDYQSGEAKADLWNDGMQCSCHVLFLQN